MTLKYAWAVCLFFPLTSAAHPLEGKWSIKKVTCFVQGEEAECPITPPKSLEISLIVESNIEKFCVKKIEDNGSISECFQSNDWASGSTTFHSKLWVSDSLNWLSILNDKTTKEVRRVDLGVRSGKTELWELTDVEDLNDRRTIEWLHVGYELSRSP